jgi:integrase
MYRSKKFPQFLNMTGLSSGEQLALKWKDINFKLLTIQIERSLSSGRNLKGTKNGFRERTIEVLNPAYDTLIELRPDGYLDNPERFRNE